MKFGIRKRMVCFMLACCMAMAVCGQVSHIKGMVIDSIDGGPLPYASVLWKGSDKGTITDENGKFSLSVSGKNVVLEISFLGYEPKQVKVASGQTENLRIALAPSNIVLNEIVVKPGRDR